MTNDELPEISPAPEQRTPESHETPREASVTDAPPVKSLRRRRVQNTGTDAASPSERTPSTPRQTRRKTKTEEITATPSAEPSVEGLSAPLPPEERATPKRTRRSTKRMEEPPAPQETTIAEAATLEEPPAKPSRTRRTRTPQPQQAESAPAPAVEEPAIEVEAPASPPAEEKPSRRRQPRRTQRATAPVESPSAEEATPTTEPSAQEATAEPESTAPEVTTTPARRNNRRRRERVQAVPPATPPTPEPQETTQEPPEPQSEEEQEASPATEGRRNRRKRDRRSRRGRAETTTPESAKEATEAEEVEALVAPAFVPEPIIIEEIPPVDTNQGAHLLFEGDTAVIRIEGVAYPPILFFGNLQEAESRTKVVSETQRAARSGVHLHSTLIELPCPLVEDSSILDEFDNRVRAILDADPEGFVIPRLVFVPAKGWRREYPHEIATYNNEPSSDPSLTSDRFWKEVERSLVTLVEHITAQSWGTRVFGYHLERGEWFQPLDQGYDRSTVNRDAFRDWLRAKYQDNIVSFRAAWHDGSVQFHTADIPPMITKPNALRAFYEPRRERCYIDFNEFTSESTARRMTSLARVIKKATYYQAVVSVCYGYLLEFGHGFSGHLALGTLLRSPHIDILSGPPSYRDRKPGGGASLPAPLGSIRLHKKLWLSEDDTKTYLAPTQQSPEDYNPRLSDRYTTDQAHYRAMGRALAYGTGIGWMDLWGEGWLDEESLWDKIANFTTTYRAQGQIGKPTKSPDVVVLLDERSLLHVQRGETFFRKLTNGTRDLLQRAGISYGIYLQEDVRHEDFPTDAKLYLFLTPYRLSEAQQSAIREKLQNGGKTLAWVYAPQSCEERPKAGTSQEEVTTTATGITLRQQEWNSEVGSRIIMPHHPITERLQYREFGTQERINPSYYADDPAATVLAEYQGSSLPSLAVRDYKSWRTVFVGEPALTMDLLRGLCRYAGVPIWVPAGEDLLTIGRSWVMIHASRDGQKTLRFPSPTGLYDLTERRHISEELREHRFFLRYGQTRIFRMGTLKDFQALNLPNLQPASRDAEHSASPSTTEPEVAPLPTPVMEVVLEPEPEESLPTLSSDVETLQAILNMKLEDFGEDAPTTLEELEGDEPFEVKSANSNRPLPELNDLLGFQKRRRRRGGRGRGRRPEGGEGGSEA